MHCSITCKSASAVVGTSEVPTLSGGFGTFSIKSTRKTPLQRRVTFYLTGVSALRRRVTLWYASVSPLRRRPSFDPPQKKAKTLHSSSGLLMSRLAVVAKGTPVELRQSARTLSRSSASRDGERGIIGKQNLYYATWFTKTPFQPNHSDSPKIHFLSRELFLCRKL